MIEYSGSRRLVLEEANKSEGNEVFFRAFPGRKGRPGRAFRSNFLPAAKSNRCNP
jgi:hypothetical protein